VALALGDEREGARIPVDSARGEKYLEYQGETVWSRSDFRQLRQIVEVSGRPEFFIPIGTKNFDLGDIYRRRIAPMVQAKDMSEVQQVPLPSRYHTFAMAALALVLIESLWPVGGRRARAIREAAAAAGRLAA
jgi:hypothetical protein